MKKRRSAPPERCRDCRGLRGRNAQIRHILTHANRNALLGHLKHEFKAVYLQDFFLSLWDGAHQLYSHIAAERVEPLWLTYLEQHGVAVKDRADVINRFRARGEQQSMTL